MRKACEPSPPAKFGECLVEQMAKQAPAPAVAFAHALHDEGWMRDFRRAGRVDIAYVLYPFRANENQGWLLVNGSPSLLDVDDFKRLPKAEMKSDLAWGRLIAQKPNAALFPGDRSGTIHPVAIVYPDGAQAVVVDYKVTDGCHACAVLGWVYFGFEFNPKGRFVYSHYLGLVSAASDEGKSGAPPWPIQARSGQKFAIVLRPGAAWSLDQPPADWIIKDAGSAGEGSNSPKWNFEIVGGGTTKLTLRSGSDELVLKVVAAPGLRR
jgi:hypothetical protein